MGDHVDRSEGKLKNAMRRVTDILKKEEGRFFAQAVAGVFTESLHKYRVEIWLLYMLPYHCADHIASACDNHVETEDFPIDEFNAKNTLIKTILLWVKSNYEIPFFSV